MDLRSNIGNRISEARKALGLSITDLVAKSENLSIGRVSNWERGTRSPRIAEIKLLAELLNVSASYLLGLSENPQDELSLSPVLRQISILSMKDMAKTGGYKGVSGSSQLIMIDECNTSHSSPRLFSTTVDDSSMEPEFNKGDIIIIDPELLPKPGDFVLVYLLEKKQILFRKYQEVQGSRYRLLANNELWAIVDIIDPNEATFLGVVVEHRRFFKANLS